jgi:hypothetical protein
MGENVKVLIQKSCLIYYISVRDILGEIGFDMRLVAGSWRSSGRKIGVNMLMFEKQFLAIGKTEFFCFVFESTD